MGIPVETVLPLVAAVLMLVRRVRRQGAIGRRTLEWVHVIEEVAGREVVLPVAGRPLLDRSVAPSSTDRSERRLRS